MDTFKEFKALFLSLVIQTNGKEPTKNQLVRAWATYIKARALRRMTMLDFINEFHEGLSFQDEIMLKSDYKKKRKILNFLGKNN